MDYSHVMRSIQDMMQHDELSWGALAARAHLSKFHFHRLFSNAVGMPAAQYIRALKLQYGLQLLLTTRMTVTEIAYACGMNSHEVFTRAFRQMFRETPSGIRGQFARRRWLAAYFKQREEGKCMYDAMDVRFLAPFTPGDKRDCLATIKLILEMSEVSRQEGLLALEPFKKKADTLFMQKGIAFVCEGYDPEIVYNILQDYINFSAHKGADLLKRMIIREGLRAIQCGEATHIISERMLAFLGEDFYDEACSSLDLEPTASEEINRRFFADMEAETYPEGTNLMEGFLLNVSDDAIQKVLREVEIKEFEPAFYGSSKKMQNKFAYNLSTRLAAQVIKSCQRTPLPTVERIINCQHKILSIYHRLVAEGEI